MLLKFVKRTNVRRRRRAIVSEPNRSSLTVMELARQIERGRIEAGVTTEEMLEGIRQQRLRYYEEMCGSAGCIV